MNNIDRKKLVIYQTGLIYKDAGTQWTNPPQSMINKSVRIVEYQQRIQPYQAILKHMGTGCAVKSSVQILGMIVEKV